MASWDFFLNFRNIRITHENRTFSSCIFLNIPSISSGSDSLELEPDELESGSEELPESDSASEFAATVFPVLRKSRKLSVRPPKPIEVKKLMAKRVFLGLSFGKSPSKKTCMVSSWSRVLSWIKIHQFNSQKFLWNFTFGRPIYWDSSWNKILMKIRDEDVVVSSVIAIVESTDQGIASAYSNCEKNWMIN